MLESHRIDQKEVKCRSVDSLWWKKQTKPQLYFWVQKHWNPTTWAQSVKRWEALGTHKIQVPGFEKEHWESRAKTAQDQPNNQREEP